VVASLLGDGVSSGSSLSPSNFRYHIYSFFTLLLIFLILLIPFIDVVKNKEAIYQQIVVASLLGDGVSSGVVVGPEHPLYQKLKNNGKNPFIVDSYSHFVPETLTELGSNLTER
jgi:hypothetical protein